MDGRSTHGRRTPRKIRYHEHEWERIVAHARACGVPPATFVRDVSLGAAPRARRNRLENDLILQLASIATDLQRLTNQAGRDHIEIDARQLEQLSSDVLSAIRRIG